MSHTFSRNHVHLIFSTKERRDTIPKEIQPQLWAYLGGIARNHEMSAIAVGGTANHVHLLLLVPPVIAVSKAALLLKSNSSKWMNESGHRFAWQDGYGAFSVSYSDLDRVTRYIQNQAAHHRKINFEDEFRALPAKHRVDYDAKFVFG